MRIVGLTGGIASGKSTVSNLFKSHGIPVVDADLVARDVLKKGTGGWKKVVAAFGEDILQEDEEVDRPKLGRIVFSDPDKRQLLNRLLAPYISSGIFWEILKLWLKGCKVIVLDIPLLFEAKMDKWTKPIIVVWVDPETQLQRLMARDRTSVEDARNRIQAQMPLDVKITQADIVIDNTRSLEELNERFQKLPWWALSLLCLSERVHSIFVLHLFNDCFATTLFHAALALLLNQKWHLGLIIFSGAVLIKMNVLLYAPPLLLLMLKAYGYSRGVFGFSRCSNCADSVGAAFSISASYRIYIRSFQSWACLHPLLVC